MVSGARWAEKEFSGWGRYPVVEATCTRPERRAELVEALKEGEGRPKLAYGLGRSYGDAALLSGGDMILTGRLDRMLSFDEGSGLLRCEAGVSLKEIIEVFLPRGWFPPVVPGTQFVTVGGAIGCNIHGKNHGHAGCFGDHVQSMEVLIGEGVVVRCSREENSRLFWATIGGMGLTGIIISAEVSLHRVESVAIEMESIRFENLDEFFEVSAESADYFYSVSWIDCVASGARMGRGIMMRGRHAEAGVELREGVLDRAAGIVKLVADGRAFQSDYLLNKATIRLFNEGYFRRLGPGVHEALVLYEPFFFPLDGVRNWNFIYGPRGFLQYQFVVPEREAVREVLEVVSASGIASFLAVIKEFGDRDHGGLSFPQGGTTLAMDFPNVGADLLTMLARLDEIVVAAGGRVYLGKDARLSRESFRRMYPGWEEWKEVRDAWDPGEVFQSDLSRRLGLSGCRRTR